MRTVEATSAAALDPAAAGIATVGGAGAGLGIYLRVSTKEQAEMGGEAEGYSIPAQREACRRKAGILGAEVVAEFVDAGESARSADRPELQRLLAYVQERSVSYLIVHKIDRLARNRADDVMINIALQAAGVQLVSCSENIDDTPSGKLLHGIMASIAEFYSQPRHRSPQGHAAKGAARRHRLQGPDRLPQRRQDHRRPRGTRTVQIDADRAPLVAWAFETYATGQCTVQRLQAELTARGLTTVPTRTRTEKPRLVPPGSTACSATATTSARSRSRVSNTTARPPARHARNLPGRAGGAGHPPLRREGTHPSPLPQGHCHLRTLPVAAVRYPNGQPAGVAYLYYFCLGRHQGRTGCTLPYLPVQQIEQLVEREWLQLRLDARYGAVLQAVERDVARLSATNTSLERRATRQLARKRNSARSSSTPITPKPYPSMSSSSRSCSPARSNSSKATSLALGSRLKLANLEVVLRKALEFLYEPAASYRAAPAALRRQFNQAVFERILITDEETQMAAEISEPFATLLDPDLMIPSTSTRLAAATDTATRWTAGAGWFHRAMNEAPQPNSPRKLTNPGHGRPGFERRWFGDPGGASFEHTFGGPEFEDGALAPPTGFEPVLPP